MGGNVFDINHNVGLNWNGYHISACNCHDVGSKRGDCHQMTGRCICKQGYEGLKCGRCAGSQAPIGSYGCMG